MEIIFEAGNKIAFVAILFNSDNNLALRKAWSRTKKQTRKRESFDVLEIPCGIESDA